MKEEGELFFGPPLGEVVPLVGETSEDQEVEVADSRASQPHHKDHATGDQFAGSEDGKQKKKKESLLRTR